MDWLSGGTPSLTAVSSAMAPIPNTQPRTTGTLAGDADWIAVKLTAAEGRGATSSDLTENARGRA